MKTSSFFIALIASTVFLIYNNLHAQDKKFKIHAISIGAGIGSTKSEIDKNGPSLDLDISSIVNRHIITFNINIAADIKRNVTEVGNGQYSGFNLMYGRKWSLSSKIAVESHLGFGLFTYTRDSNRNILGFSDTVYKIGFPLKAKLIYYPLDKFGIGVSPYVNFNSVTTAYNGNLILQYNFN